MDVKALRWFEHLKRSYATKISIGLMDATQIIHELMHRRTLRNTFFPGAALDTAELRRLITRTGELSFDELAALSAENAEQFMEKGLPYGCWLPRTMWLIRRWPGRMLEAAGIRPDMAGNGVEAVTMHRMMHYDAILMDCQMPEMNGFEATAEIRRLDGNSRRMAIIAMTAETTAGSTERCLASGMDDYIAKPIKTAELVDALRKWA